MERLFVQYVGAEVKKGDRLVEIYSPELVAAQQELLSGLRLGARVDLDLVAAGRRKLKRLGVIEAEIDELIKTGRVRDRITLAAPITGTVIEKNVVEQSAVAAGDVLYRLANLESVWVDLEIYEYELPLVEPGQEVEAGSEAYPGQVFRGRVWLVNPVLSEETRTVKLLLSLDTPGHRLKPGMFVSAILRSGLKDGEPWPLAVPAGAVLDSGVRKLVYVEKDKGRFEAVEIKTGPRAGGYYPVAGGLAEGDRVAVAGAFLLDSQLQIQGLPSLFNRKP